jgi:hypothetical protein
VRAQPRLGIAGIDAIKQAHAAIASQALRGQYASTAALTVEDRDQQAAQACFTGIVEGGTAAKDQQQEKQPASA